MLNNEIPYGYCNCGCGKTTTISKHTSRKYNRIKGEPTLYLPGHGNREKPIDYTVDKETGCWIWQRYVDKQGYGRVSKPINGTVLAYKIYYEIANDRVPDGYALEHICSNRLCVNPVHMQILTRQEQFWRHVNIKESSDCWEWLSGCDVGGYGVFQFDGKPQKAHRLSYQWAINTPQGRLGVITCLV